ncbi:MAG: hypothetical protein KGD57_02270 [Candidatus Lokiarchaeota archaeon]|nr:hypothetical protein [Candidatus Lokiarchaeota archaeon]
MIKNRLKVIIWDLDGTIIHFNIDFIKARKVVISILEKFGIPEGYLVINNNISEYINKAISFFETNKFI